MRKKHIVVIMVVLCAVFLSLTGDLSLAVNYDTQIQEAEEEKEESASKVKELQEEIEELEKEKDDTLAYIEKLDKKTEKLEKELSLAAKAIKKTKKEIKAAQEELEESEKTAEIQYDTMKKRIKYMYENGNQDYLDMVFTSKNIADLLNRAEYVEKISDYDEKMFTEYEKTKNTIEEKTKELDKQLVALENYQYEQEEEKKALQELKKQKKEELKNYKKKVKSSKKQSDKYAEQAAKAEAEVEKLLKAKQEEIDSQNGTAAGGTGGDGTLEWPLNASGRISSGFGHRSSPTAGASTYHRGLDIAITAGTPVMAAGDGKVVTATYSSSAGNYVMISHGDRLYTVYMHCSSLAVSEGDTVTKGQTIGYVGSTGISTGAHLHFGVSKNGTYKNPLNYVKQP